MKKSDKNNRKNKLETNKKVSFSGLTSLNRNSTKSTDLAGYLIVIIYILVVTFTPNWMALDTNAPKFLTLSIVNLFTFVYLYFIRNWLTASDVYRTLKSNVAISYLGFLLFSVLSFTQAISIKESYLQFAKLFSVFSFAVIMALLVINNGKLVRFLAIVFASLLVFDALSVFYYIGKFIDGEILYISDIKTVYSNKNILASSIFVKLPFAIWLMFTGSKLLRNVGWVSLTLGVLATFFMATRAFYLGLAVLSSLFLIGSLLLYVKDKNKLYLKLSGLYALSLILAFLMFTFVQTNLYPKTGERHVQGIADQVSTIKDFDKSAGLRISAWKFSVELIKEHPYLGVGSGNWKIQVLKHENKSNPGFIYLYKAHNDFLENTAEAGVLGGLHFLFIFIFSGLNLIRQYFRKDETQDHTNSMLFLGFAGLAFYAVDAFFNFPADRPEILILFAAFVGFAMAGRIYQVSILPIDNDVTSSNSKDHRVSNLFKKGSPLFYITGVLIAGILVGSVYLFERNFRSVKLQRVVYEEIVSGALRAPSSTFVGKFPALPEISIWGESINAITARYLLEEKKYREAISLLLNDRSNPFDSRREFFLAMAYNELKVTDSAFYYSEIAYNLKPNYFRNLHIYLNLLEQKNRQQEVSVILDHYFTTQKDEVNAWLYASGFYERTGNLEKSMDLMNEAKLFHPNDSLIRQQERYIYYLSTVKPNIALFDEAVNLFNSQNYTQALKKFDEFIVLAPLDLNALRMRAFTLYHLQQYESSIEQINEYFKISNTDAQLINLRGVVYLAMNELDKACRDFARAASLGDNDGKTNVERFCRGGN